MWLKKQKMFGLGRYLSDGWCYAGPKFAAGDNLRQWVAWVSEKDDYATWVGGGVSA